MPKSTRELLGSWRTGSYTYDGNGFRVEKSASGTTTVSVYSGSRVIAEYDNGAVPNSPSREYIYGDSDGGARLLAMMSGGTTEYFHQDHLSVRLITNANGTNIGEQGHYPFGESLYQNNSTTEWRFTTYQRDQESGLDYALARFYNSRVGGFCSVDPLDGNPDDPQSWNRYSYAENDPINLIDPSGKGFLTWLFDALAILADIFSGGATTPETIELGISLQGVSDLALFAAVVQTGKATAQQGQQQPQQTPPPQGTPGNTRTPVYCQPNVMAAMRLAYQTAQMKNIVSQLHSPGSVMEGGFPVYQNPDGSITVGNGTADAPLDKQIQYGPETGWDPAQGRSDAAAVFHSHPSGAGLPSSPGDTAGSGSGDTGYAVSKGIDNYVISWSGLSVAKATGPIKPPKGWNPWIIQGNGLDDWLKKLKAKCSQ